MSKIKQWASDFKQFAMRGNVVDMAVGIIIGAAFGKIVASLVSDIMMPLIGLIWGGVDFQTLSYTLREAEVLPDGVTRPASVLRYGNFIQVTIDFLCIAFSVFLMIKLFVSLQRKKEAAPATPPPTPEDTLLLRDIRDLLKNNKDNTPSAS
ncbi:MAG: large-conductance mechanosensitive channel protein MscL [Marinifilaceae bacterium]